MLFKVGTMIDPIYNRPFELKGPDSDKMWRFLQEDYAHRQDRFIWHIGRLGDWLYGLWNEQKYIPTFFPRHAQLWLDDFERLLGFVIDENGDNTFFIFTQAGYEYLYPAILDWTIAHWNSRAEALVAEVHEFQTAELAELERRGFRSRGAAAMTREYDLRMKVDEAIRLAAGYRIVKMVENGDFPAKARLFKDGFSGSSEVSELDLLMLEYSRESPAYDPALDFSVVAPDGTHAATCVGFVDHDNRAAEVEKVCTHRGYRRQGLAEAVIRECFQHLYRRGIERAYITGYSGEANDLYEKLGPCKRKQWFHYELKTAERKI
jgi:ribosomal protein S18 acetylase RimI-like enzyme